MSAPVIGIEMGGTKCVLLVGTGPTGILDERVIPTTTPAATLGEISAVIDGWIAAHRPAAIGIASFGPLELDPASPEHGRIIATPKPGWSDTDILAPIVRRYGLPAAIETDVIGAALAEGLWGAARGLADHAYVTVGTGVGVGIISAGRPLAGASHGELGHARLARAPGDRWPGICPFHGDCVEGLVSGPALAARLGQPGSTVGIDHPAWDGIVHTLTMLLHTIVLAAAPRRISIGGGVVTGRDALFPRLRAALAASLAGYGATPRFLPDMAAAVGPPGLGALAGPLGSLAVGLAALERTGAR